MPNFYAVGREAYHLVTGYVHLRLLPLLHHISYVGALLPDRYTKSTQAGGRVYM